MITTPTQVSLPPDDLMHSSIDHFPDLSLLLTSSQDSEISTDDEDDFPGEETLAERILALKDMIPPATRSYIANKFDVTTSWVKSGVWFGGKTLWVVSTSALLLGVPWALAFAEEQQMVEMEKEMRMREMGGEVGGFLISFFVLDHLIKFITMLIILQLLSNPTAAGALNAQLGQQQSQPAL